MWTFVPLISVTGRAALWCEITRARVRVNANGIWASAVIRECEHSFYAKIDEMRRIRMDMGARDGDRDRAGERKEIGMRERIRENSIMISLYFLTFCSSYTFLSCLFLCYGQNFLCVCLLFSLSLTLTLYFSKFSTVWCVQLYRNNSLELCKTSMCFFFRNFCWIK